MRAGSFARALVAVATGLVVMHLIAMQAYFNDALGIAERFGLEYWHVSIFDLDAEESFGTWFSAGVLALAAMLLHGRSRLARAEPGGWHLGWFILSLGFLFLSVDEVVGLHEYLNTFLEDGSWTVVGAGIAAVVGLSFVPFLIHYRGRTALLFLVAGAIYVGGAVGVEHFTDAEVTSLHYNMWTALEEGLEMFGAILFVYALMDEMERRGMRLSIEAGPGAGEAGP